jgi:hypothetical protein
MSEFSSSEFSCIATETFDRLAARHDLTLVERERAAVVYESAVCRIYLGYDDQRSFEVGLSLSQNGGAVQPGFNFDEIMRAQAVPSHLWVQGYSARDPQHVRRLLEQMEKIISEYAAPLLDGNRMAWVNLENRRQADCIEYEEEVKMRRVQEDLDKAWNARDYAKVAKVLEGIESKLSGSDLGKLKYAKKQLGHAT